MSGSALAGPDIHGCKKKEVPIIHPLAPTNFFISLSELQLLLM